jgi:hypothetical protein
MDDELTLVQAAVESDIPDGDQAEGFFACVAFWNDLLLSRFPRLFNPGNKK